MHIIYKLLHILIVASLVLLFASPAFAQNDDAVNTFTPYSFYGVGDLARPGMAHNLGMGGIGTGLRTSRHINFLNPAALTAQDSLSFMFDFGVESQNYYASALSGGQKQQSAANNFNIHHLAFSFPIHKRLVVGLGLLPFSSVGYGMQRMDTMPNNLVNAGKTYYTYRGEGGINQVSFSLGADIGYHISLGGQVQYYFGNIDRYSNIDFEDLSISSLTSGTSLNIGNFGFTLGAQYERPLGKDLSLVVGATYQFATKMGTEKLDFAYTQTSTLTDTVRWSTNADNLMSLPATISGGVSLRKYNNWAVGLDYVYQNWQQQGFENASELQKFRVVPSHLIRTGFEWTPSRTDFRHYLNRCSYRIGFSYENTYMQFDNNQIKNISGTIGLSLPINRWNNSVNFAAEVGNRGTTNNGLVKELYVKFSVSFSVYDIWFVKPKID